MALKTTFEDSNVISSPFVDEVANPGQGGGTLGQIQRNADKVQGMHDDRLGTSKPVPVTGEPATEVVHAASPSQLRKQGSKETTVLERQRQINAARKKSKE